MRSDYFETSEAEDVAGSLRHLKLSLVETRKDPQAWKWVVLSLFSAVQGSIVCHASGSAQIECLTTDSANNMLAWLNDRTATRCDAPEVKLASPRRLFRRLNGTYQDFPPSGGIIVTDQATELYFERVVELRNNFSHFSPKGWAIEKPFIIEAIPALLELILKIHLSGYAFRHLDNRTEVPTLISELLGSLGNP